LVDSVRSYLLLLGLLCCSVSALADWESNTVRDPTSDLAQFSVRSSDDFPMFTLSCVSNKPTLVDMLQVDRLTRVDTGAIEVIEVRVDSNSAMIFYPDQHNIIVGYQYHAQLESGIETVTMTPAGSSGEIQFAELIRQFIEGYKAVVQVKSAEGETRVAFSLLGFTQAYLAARTDCLSF